jgi:hypothetical protein
MQIYFLLILRDPKKENQDNFQLWKGNNLDKESKDFLRFKEQTNNKSKIYNTSER